MNCHKLVQEFGFSILQNSIQETVLRKILKPSAHDKGRLRLTIYDKSQETKITQNSYL